MISLKTLLKRQLVKYMYKLTTCTFQYTVIFCLKNVRVFSHFSNKNNDNVFCIIYIFEFNKKLTNNIVNFQPPTPGPKAFCPPPFRRKAEIHSFRLSVCPSFRLSVPLKYYVPCVRNSSYSFMPIHLNLYRCFCHVLKICMWFGYYPEIIFCHFFRSLNLAIF